MCAHVCAFPGVGTGEDILLRAYVCAYERGNL